MRRLATLTTTTITTLIVALAGAHPATAAAATCTTTQLGVPSVNPLQSGEWYAETTKEWTASCTTQWEGALELQYSVDGTTNWVTVTACDGGVYANNVDTTDCAIWNPYRGNGGCNNGTSFCANTPVGVPINHQTIYGPTAANLCNTNSTGVYTRWSVYYDDTSFNVILHRYSATVWNPAGYCS